MNSTTTSSDKELKYLYQSDIVDFINDKIKCLYTYVVNLTKMFIKTASFVDVIQYFILPLVIKDSFCLDGAMFYKLEHRVVNFLKIYMDDCCSRLTATDCLPFYIF